ncbi:MAG: hypothetical protein ACFFFC_00955 [Candidatus Thorarchaeota archaeon]
MIVELMLLSVGISTVLKVPMIAKIIGAKKILGKTRKQLNLGNIIINIDEFINNDGEKIVDFSIMETEKGEIVVLSQAETLLFSQQQLVEFLIENKIVPNSNEGWLKLISSLLELIEERRKEILKSPGRRGIRR